jgi:hypothetical protein
MKRLCSKPECRLNLIDAISAKEAKKAREAREKVSRAELRDNKLQSNKQKKIDIKKKKEFNRKDLGWQHKNTQPVFNRMRVIEELKWFNDAGIEPTCISCGKINMDWCCGHFKTVGAQGILRYDRNNTYLQCNRYCNMGLSGNIAGNKNTRGYKQGLIDRFGKNEAAKIFDYCEQNNNAKKWEWQELEEMRMNFFKRIKELENA